MLNMLPLSDLGYSNGPSLNRAGLVYPESSGSKWRKFSILISKKPILFDDLEIHMK